MPAHFCRLRAAYLEFTMANALVVCFAASIEEALAKVAEGFEPVECSFGGNGSVVGPLVMDHHGAHSALEGVAVRAYRDHFGVRAADPRFVVTGAADADATFAIAALAGMLPHPSRAAEFEKAPPFIKGPMTRDLLPLAELVNTMDVDPIPHVAKLPDTEEGRALLLFHALASHEQDSTAFQAGVDTWRLLTGSRPPAALLKAVGDEEARRIADALAAPMTMIGNVLYVESEVWGFDVWYGIEARPAAVLAYVAKNGNYTIGCPSGEAAEKAFGPGGLKNVFPKLGEGWGGREAIGGSPRGVVFVRGGGEEIAAKIDAEVRVAR